MCLFLYSGANCNHAWSVLTGVKEQYLILRKTEGDDKSPWVNYAKYNPSKDHWPEQDNNPYEGFQSVWEVPWPDVSGGGWDELSDKALFDKMCSWDDNNFLMACSSKGSSDKENTDGIINAHAYGVVECR